MKLQVTVTSQLTHRYTSYARPKTAFYSPLSLSFLTAGNWTQLIHFFSFLQRPNDQSIAFFATYWLLLSNSENGTNSDLLLVSAYHDVCGDLLPDNRLIRHSFDSPIVQIHSQDTLVDPLDDTAFFALQFESPTAALK